MLLRVVTCERMDGKGLMGLNDVHLELKVDGAAASQRNSMANARDRWVKEVRLFPLCFDTGSGWKRKHGWLYGKEHKETGEPPGRREVKEQSIEEPTTHIQYGTHTPLSKWYGR